MATTSSTLGQRRKWQQSAAGRHHPRRRRQIISPADEPESAQTPGIPTPVGSFSVTELALQADKIGKDDNFRGLTIFNNVLYYYERKRQQWSEHRLFP